MKQENGKGTVKFVFIICIILIVAFGIFKYVQSLINKEQVKDLHADMLLVQAKVEMVKGKNSVNSDENPLIGIKASEIVNQYNALMEYEKNKLNAKYMEGMQTEQQTNQSVETPEEQTTENQENTYNGPDITLIKQYNISKFINYNVLTSEEYEKYYLLNDDNLNSLDLAELVGRYKGYFIVNYDTYEVIYSEGYENLNGLWCYKISDLNKKSEPEYPVQNNEQTTKEQSAVEEQTEQQATE